MPEASDSLTLAGNALALDSLAVDSLQLYTEPQWGVTLQAPPRPEPVAVDHPAAIRDDAASWLTLLLLIPFVIIGIKMKNTSRFIASLFQDLTSIRERHSIFDTTVRETSMLFWLITLTTVAGGVLLGTATLPTALPPGHPLPPPLEWITSGGTPEWLSGVPYSLLHSLVCIILMTAYMFFIWIAYMVAGRVFETAVATHLWIQGFAASMGLLGLLLLPLALIAISMPEWTYTLVIIAVVAFILAKITFIWKGFRIFCSKGASWVLFLYYLCSLEVVPVILVIAAASFRG